MKKILLSLILILMALAFVFPVGMTIVQSFGSGETIQITGYLDLFLDCFVFYPMFWHSVLYSVSITALQLVVIIPCAFGFIHGNFKGRKLLYVFYIILMMMPLQVTILPNYIGLRDLGLLDTPMSIILPMIFSPFGVIVMHQYMKNMDDSVIEAARMETSSIIRILITAVVPQLRVCIFAVVMFVFAETWNMLEQPMLFLKDNNLKTLTVMFTQTDKFTSEILYSAAVIFMIPVLLLYLFFNENLEQGLNLKDL